MKATLFYLHDPMCSWCWGFRPVWDEIQAKLLERYPTLTITYIAGGLAPDTDQLMPAEQRKTIESYWRRITAELGTTFNHDFWTKNEPKRSTYLACRAVLAAKRQHQEKNMIHLIQEGYYLGAQNPSEEHVLIEIAGQLFSDDSLDKFIEDIRSGSIEEELQQSIEQCERLHELRLANGFPSLVLGFEKNLQRITQDYLSVEVTLQHIDSILKRAEVIDLDS